MIRIMGRVRSAADAERDGFLNIAGDRDSMLELLALFSFAEVD